MDKITVHDEFAELCARMAEYPSDHSDVVLRMKAGIEAELVKLPPKRAIPYRPRGLVPEAPKDEVRRTTRVSAAGVATHTGVSKSTLAYEEEEEEDQIPHHVVLHPKQYATMDRTNVHRDVRRYREIVNQAAGIQHTALAHIDTLVGQLDG
jgi:hypothetical protein